MHIDPTDGNGDGLPDALRFALPADVQTLAQLDATTGKLTLFLADTTPPLTPFPTGNIANLTMTARCRPAYGTTVTTGLTFASTPRASFSDLTAHALLGGTQAGALVIQPAVAADLICTVLVIFNGSAACALPATAAAAAGATLSLPATLTANAGQTVALPVRLTGSDQRVAAAIFALDFDPTLLHFDPTDRNGDTLPDAVTLALPAGVTPKITVAAQGGQLQFVLADLAPPLTPLPDGDLAVIHLTAQATQPTTTTVAFATKLPASLGGVWGQRLPVVINPGTILVNPSAPAALQRRFYLPVTVKNE